MVSSPGLRHALQILDLLAREPDGLGFTALREALGVAPPTASRLLKVLVEERFAEKSKQGRYRVGARLASIAQRWTGGSPLALALEPLVDELALASGESAAWVEWGPAGITFRAKREMPESYHYMAIGSSNRDPTTNGFGQVALAWHPEELERFGRPREREALRERLSGIRRTTVHEHRDLGLRLCAAVPGADGGLAGVLGISSLHFDMPAARRAQLKRLVRDSAHRAADIVSAITTRQG